MSWRGGAWIRRLAALAAGGAVTGVGLSAVAAVPNPPPSSRELPRCSTDVTLVTPGSAPKWNNNWDMLEPRSDSDEKPTACRHVILIRHGQYNLRGRTDAEKTLTPIGQQQLHLTGQRLADLGVTFDRLIFSTKTRAMESGQIISKYLPEVPVETCDLIREGAPFVPDPPLRDPKYPYYAYKDGPIIEAGFRKYFHRASSDQKADTHEVLVCHANVSRYFLCRALQLPPEAWLRMSKKNGSITWLTVWPDGNVTLRQFGDAGFLPKDLLTTS